MGGVERRGGGWERRGRSLVVVERGGGLVGEDGGDGVGDFG